MRPSTTSHYCAPIFENIKQGCGNKWWRMHAVELSMEAPELTLDLKILSFKRAFFVLQIADSMFQAVNVVGDVGFVKSVNLRFLRFGCI